MTFRNDEPLHETYSRLCKKLSEKEKSDDKESAELINKLNKRNFTDRAVDWRFNLIDLLAKNGNNHTLRAAYEKYPDEQKPFIAACFGFKHKLAEMIKKDVGINASLPSGQTLLYLAAKYGHLHTVKMLHDAHVDVNCETILYKLIAAGDYQALNARLAMYVDPTIVSPLYAATEGRHHEVMAFLIKHGADVHKVSLEGKLLASALYNGDVAASMGHIHGYTHYAHNDRFAFSAMHIAARNDDVDALAILIKHGANINQSVKHGGYFSSTPLIDAVRAGSVKAVAYLIKNGADLGCHGCDYFTSHDLATTDKYGFTPLHVAAMTGNTDIITMLLDVGVNLNVKGMDEYDVLKKILNRTVNFAKTALDYAAINNHPDAFNLLLKQGAVFGNRCEVMGEVISKNHVEMLKILLDHKVDSDAILSGYLTKALIPSHHNNNYPDINMIKLLLSSGAKVTDKQIQQTENNGLDYLLDALKAAKAKQGSVSSDKVQIVAPVITDDASVKAKKSGFIAGIFGRKVKSDSTEHHNDSKSRVSYK